MGALVLCGGRCVPTICFPLPNPKSVFPTLCLFRVFLCSPPQICVPGNTVFPVCSSVPHPKSVFPPLCSCVCACVRVFPLGLFLSCWCVSCVCPVVLVCSLCVCVVPPSVFVLFLEAGQAPGQAQTRSSDRSGGRSTIRSVVPVGGGAGLQRPLSVGSVPLLSSQAGPLSYASVLPAGEGLIACQPPRSAPLSSVFFVFF